MYSGHPSVCRASPTPTSQTRRFAILRTLLLWGATAALPTRAHSQPRVAVRLEAGPEFDSNPARLEEVKGAPAPQIDTSSLLRTVGAADLVLPISARQTLAATAGAGGKLFLNQAARPEDVAVAQATAIWSLGLSERIGVSASATYYDAFARGGGNAGDPRDFRSIGPSGRIDHTLGPLRLSAGGGYRWFTWKPRPDFDFQAPTLFASVHHQVRAALGSDAADWDWGISGNVEARRFRGARCESLDACPPADPAKQQPWRDRFVVIGADVTRTADTLLGAGVALHLNYSNSYAQSLGRVVLHTRAVVLLPWDLSLSGRIEAVFTRYADGVPLRVDPAGKILTSIEDESRSTIRIDLVRSLAEGFEIGLRCSLFTNDLGGGPVSYGRYTGLVFGAINL